MNCIFILSPHSPPHPLFQDQRNSFSFQLFFCFMLFLHQCLSVNTKLRARRSVDKKGFFSPTISDSRHSYMSEQTSGVGDRKLGLAIIHRINSYFMVIFPSNHCDFLASSFAHSSLLLPLEMFMLILFSCAPE